jgi:hypothetical protein
LKTIRVLALDLEGTLISNAVSQIPRPGLRAFLDGCHVLVGRIVAFTAVGEERFREIAAQLVADGDAPEWYASVEHVRWSGVTKDLHCIPGVLPEEVLLVDDYEPYVHPGQESQWIRVPGFEPPYPATDRALEMILEILRQRVA